MLDWIRTYSRCILSKIKGYEEFGAVGILDEEMESSKKKKINSVIIGCFN